MRVDAHHHVWDLTVRDQPWTTGVIRRSFGVEDLLPLASQGSVEATVLVQTVTVPEETPEFLALAEQWPLVQAVVGWTDLTAEDVADRLAELTGGTGGRWLRGIRHQVQGEPDPDWLCRAEVRRGLAAVGQAGLVYELLTLPHQLPAAVRTVSELPEVRFVLDHCSKPPIASGELEPWAGEIRRLAAWENVACKLSGLVTEADHANWSVADLRPYAEVVLAAFGPDRVMFGSDWPVCLLAAEYPEVLDATEQLTAELSAAERERVFGGTATEVYRLRPGP
ncbi:amidohydrolase family protein [Kutzneria albida]|uniref:Amidohydrolase 2 n=1 Tax=Kutzneria albida DSM 43870 TaxID=1449976 RepID=W5VZ55_9PSEU|nr:amidohydrolase family protein [Kutzneria albida]AHH93857.1 amidohydrolase 2 [Kutzneria albida DSM 43870]